MAGGALTSFHLALTGTVDVIDGGLIRQAVEEKSLPIQAALEWQPAKFSRTSTFSRARPRSACGTRPIRF
jgi:hypothetical protein